MSLPYVDQMGNIKASNMWNLKYINYRSTKTILLNYRFTCEILANPVKKLPISLSTTLETQIIWHRLYDLSIYGFSKSHAYAYKSVSPILAFMLFYS